MNINLCEIGEFDKKEARMLKVLMKNRNRYCDDVLIEEYPPMTGNYRIVLVVKPDFENKPEEEIKKISLHNLFRDYALDSIVHSATAREWSK